MGKPISLFNNYHTGENIVSNYCGLILKLLYEDNPNSFEEVIATLTSEDFQIRPSFKQQEKRGNSIPDIVIEQQSFSIFFETKKFDWYHDTQIDKHLEGLYKDQTSTHKILFLLSNFEGDNPEEKFQEQIKQAKNKFEITLCPISFEKLLGVLETIETSGYLKAYIAELRDFLEESNLLPTWSNLLDVVNCASTISEVHQYNVYMCPDSGGRYQHRRALFFGGYKSKNVKYIHEIKALVVIEQGGIEGRVKWKNYTQFDDKTLIQEAIEKINQFTYRKNEIKERDIQVFLLQNPVEVNFRKSSPGGMYSSKKYFPNIAAKARNSKELAEQIKGTTWE